MTLQPHGVKAVEGVNVLLGPMGYINQAVLMKVSQYSGSAYNSTTSWGLALSFLYWQTLPLQGCIHLALPCIYLISECTSVNICVTRGFQHHGQWHRAADGVYLCDKFLPWLMRGFHIFMIPLILSLLALMSKDDNWICSSTCPSIPWPYSGRSFDLCVQVTIWLAPLPGTLSNIYTSNFVYSLGSTTAYVIFF